MKLIVSKEAFQNLENGCYPDVLTVQDVQKVLGIGRASVYHLIETGQIQAFRIGRVYKIPKKSLEAFLETRGEVL